MIVRFSVENFRSIREKQELTLVASSLKDRPDSLIRIDQAPHILLPVAAIYGPNASGKTNVLRALHWMSTAVANSYRRWSPSSPIPHDPFILDSSRDQPSRFEVEFIVNSVRYRYGFVTDSEKFREEWLYAYPSGKQQQWFFRNEDPKRIFTFSRNLRGEKNRTIEELTRPNSLYLSTAAQNNHEALLPIYNFLTRSICFSITRREMSRTENMCSDEKRKEKLLSLLKAADLGIEDLRTEETELDEKNKKVMFGVISVIKESMPSSSADIPLPLKTTNIFFRHRGQEGTGNELKFEDESDGTRAYFALLGPVIEALESGGVLCVDELESSLHPLLAIELIRLFNERASNPRGAQMIFSTHDTNLLNSHLLRRDQVWFTEKDGSGATHLYPLSDFRPRKGENLERGYLQGRYGAVPFIDDDLTTLSKD